MDWRNTSLWIGERDDDKEEEEEEEEEGADGGNNTDGFLSNHTQ